MTCIEATRPVLCADVDRALIAQSERVITLAQLDFEAFESLRELERQYADQEPAFPKCDDPAQPDHQAALRVWWQSVEEFEQRVGITAAGRLADRAADRTEAAAAKLAAMPATGVDGLLAKGRAAEAVRQYREGLGWVLDLDRSIARDVRALAQHA